MKRLKCTVISIDHMIDNVFKVHLLPSTDFYFRAGQYLRLVISEKDKCYFSVASTPMEKNRIELHIRASKSNTHAMKLIEWIHTIPEVIIEIPYGNAWLREDTNRPMILIAGGTGFAYVRSILFTVLLQQPERLISLYWSGRKLSNLYALEELKVLSCKYTNFKVIPIIESVYDYWNGSHPTVLNAVIRDYCNLSSQDIYLAGNFEMAKSAREIFCKMRGAIVSRIFGDAFTFI
ncbi:MAG: NAD(P)H-flavin reductase [Candidatus Dasytiphilus stammeri]